MSQLEALPEKAAVEAMIRSIQEWLAEHYPYHTEHNPMIPPNMRVEMHPYTWHLVMRHVDALFLSGNWDEQVRQRFIVPVKITPDMDRYTFRLVTVTEDVHIGGRLLGGVGGD